MQLYCPYFCELFLSSVFPMYQRDKLDPDLHQFADDKPAAEMYGKWAYLSSFKGFEPYLEARIRIRIRF